MKKILFFILFFISLKSIGQTYNPVNFTLSNKSYGPAQAVPTDARSFFYDSANFVMRPYKDTIEVLTYLNIAKWRGGNYLIYVHSGGVLNANGTFTGGTVAAWWFKDGVADVNLVPFSTTGGGGTGVLDTLYYNVKWFGATGDGVTNDRAAIQTTNDLVASIGGGVVWFPKGTYNVDRPLYRSDKVNWFGVKDASVIKNTNATLTTFASQGCMFMGNYNPSAYDTTVARYFRGHAGTYSNKMAIVDSISKFSVGDIVLITGMTGWVSNDGHFKPYVVRTNEIDSIYSDTVVFKYQLDTLLTDARVHINRHFITPNNDAYGHAVYMVKDCETKNLSFESQGEWMLGVTALNCRMENIHIRAAELLSANGLAFCNITNLYGNWWKQCLEFAIGCHNTTVDGVNGQFINGNYLTDAERKPFIKLGENVYALHLRNISVNSGNFDGTGVWLGAATHCVLDNIHVKGQKLEKTHLELSTTEGDDSVSSYVNNNVIRNSTFENTSNLQYYVYIHKPPIPGARLENNVIDNCTFTGSVSPSHALVFDGYKTLVKNSDFGSGIVTFGDSTFYGIIENTALGNPSVYNANVMSLNVHLPTISTIAPLIAVENVGTLVLNGNPGTNGQVLTSQGNSTPPIWATVSGSGGGGDSILSFQKNAGGDSAILTMFDGRRFAVKDSTGILPETWEQTLQTQGSIPFTTDNIVNIGNHSFLLDSLSNFQVHRYDAGNLADFYLGTNYMEATDAAHTGTVAYLFPQGLYSLTMTDIANNHHHAEFIYSDSLIFEGVNTPLSVKFRGIDSANADTNSVAWFDADNIIHKGHLSGSTGGSSSSIVLDSFVVDCTATPTSCFDGLHPVVSVPISAATAKNVDISPESSSAEGFQFGWSATQAVLTYQAAIKGSYKFYITYYQGLGLWLVLGLIPAAFSRRKRFNPTENYES